MLPTFLHVATGDDGRRASHNQFLGIKAPNAAAKSSVNSIKRSFRLPSFAGCDLLGVIHYEGIRAFRASAKGVEDIWIEPEACDFLQPTFWPGHIRLTSWKWRRRVGLYPCAGDLRTIIDELINRRGPGDTVRGRRGPPGCTFVRPTGRAERLRDHKVNGRGQFRRKPRCRQGGEYQRNGLSGCCSKEKEYFLAPVVISLKLEARWRREPTQEEFAHTVVYGDPAASRLEAGNGVNFHPVQHAVTAVSDSAKCGYSESS